MLVATGLLVVIMLGLTTMFTQTQRAFRSGLKQTDVYEGGRAVMGLLTRDLESAVDSGVPFVTNFNYFALTDKMNKQSGDSLERTNELDYLYVLSHDNREWTGTAYTFSNALPGVADLYRFQLSTNADRLSSDNYFHRQFIKNYDGSKNTNVVSFHRVASGIIHFKVRTFDSRGVEFRTNETDVSFPLFYTNITAAATEFGTSAIPSYVEIELGILEPQTLEQARSLGTGQVADYLSKQMGKVHIFRQQIPLRNAPR